MSLPPPRVMYRKSELRCVVLIIVYGMHPGTYALKKNHSPKPHFMLHHAVRYEFWFSCVRVRIKTVRCDAVPEKPAKAKKPHRTQAHRAKKAWRCVRRGPVRILFFGCLSIRRCGAVWVSLSHGLVKQHRQTVLHASAP